MTSRRTPVKKKTASLAKSKPPIIGGNKGKVTSARRCQKCPSKPFRHQCVHTKAGRAHLEQLNSLPPSSPPPPSSPTTAFSPLTFSSPVTGFTSPPNSIVTTPTPLSAPLYSRPIIDPFLLAAPHPGGISEANVAHAPFDPRSSAIVEVYDPRDTMSAPSAPSTPLPATGPSALRSSQTGSSRVRISGANAIHGLVEGAKQGNKPYAVVRTKQLRPPQTDGRLAGKRFYRGMQDLIIRAENLSKETGAWIYLAGQHVNGTNGYTSYASPRLRRDAKDELTNIQNQFNSMTTALITSRRREAVELSFALQKANEERQAAQEALTRFKSALDTSDLTTTLTKDAFIAKLRELAASGEDSS